MKILTIPFPVKQINVSLEGLDNSDCGLATDVHTIIILMKQTKLEQ